MIGTWKPGLTLERIDNNEDYCPDNCRWATQLEQLSNQNRPEYEEIIQEIIRRNNEELEKLGYIRGQYYEIQVRFDNHDWFVFTSEGKIYRWNYEKGCKYVEMILCILNKRKVLLVPFNSDSKRHYIYLHRYLYILFRNILSTTTLISGEEANQLYQQLKSKDKICHIDDDSSNNNIWNLVLGNDKLNTQMRCYNMSQKQLTEEAKEQPCDQTK